MNQLRAKFFKNQINIDILVLIYLLTLGLLIQLPTFFKVIQSTDESTFILMGQSILDGHLPYTELWDIKPPLAFFFFAAVITVFGKSIVLVRMAGSICLILAGFFTYKVGKKIWNYRTGILSGSLLIIIVTSGTIPGTLLFPVTVATIAIFPLVAALYVIVKSEKITHKVCLFTGLLIGIATMIRLNLAYNGILVGLIIFFTLLQQKPISIKGIVKCAVAYTIGVLFPVIITYIPYLITGYQDLWWSSVILASLSYSNTDLSMLGALGAQARYLWAVISNSSSIGINLLIWFGGGIGLLALLRNFSKMEKLEKRRIIFLITFLMATEISILKGGKAFGHYYIQIYPFLALITAKLLDYLLFNISSWITMIFLVLSVSGIFPLIFSEYNELALRIIQGKPIPYGIPYKIKEYLRQENYNGEPIFIINHHLVYWLVNSKPMSKSTTQPYNITNDKLLPYMTKKNASTESELKKILAKNPKYIIAKSSSSFRGEAGNILRNTIKNHYKLVKTIDTVKIFHILE